MCEQEHQSALVQVRKELAQVTAELESMRTPDGVLQPSGSSPVAPQQVDASTRLPELLRSAPRRCAGPGLCCAVRCGAGLGWAGLGWAGLG